MDQDSCASSALPAPRPGEALLAEILARLDALKPRSIDDYGADDVIPTAELAALLRLSEDSAREWAARWGVRSSERGRWPVHRIRLGLRKEAMQGGRAARRPGRSRPQPQLRAVSA